MALDGTDFECPGSDHIIKIPKYCSMCDKHFCKACKHSCDENYMQNASKFFVKKLQRLQFKCKCGTFDYNEFKHHKCMSYKCKKCGVTGKSLKGHKC